MGIEYSIVGMIGTWIRIFNSWNDQIGQIGIEYSIIRRIRLGGLELNVPYSE
jgi:hypothetical protein